MLSILVGTAYAFCGAYVGGADSELTNSDSRIVIARSGYDVRLTMFNDIGDVNEDFGLIVPIPQRLDARHVRLVHEDVMTVTDRYAEPRLVEYSCENFYTTDDDLRANVHPFLATTGCSASPGGARWGLDPDDSGYDEPAWVDTANGVVVEEQFVLGEYSIFVLKAGEAEGLLNWMEGNGFVAPVETADVLQDYIDDDQYFLAARVDPSLMTSHWLSPLQLHYQSESMVLPIRLGATSSGGVQDLVVTVINDAYAGRTGISNYGAESEMYRDCMVDGLDYGEMWTQVSGIPDNAADAEGVDEFAWTTEYSWDVTPAEFWGTGPNGEKCDPCIVAPEARGDDAFPNWVVEELGYPWPDSGYHVTRLRLRYTPGGVTDDLVLYDTHDTTRQQNRYIVHKWELESLIPVCDTEQPRDPGACYTSEYWARQAQGELTDSYDTVETNTCGCSTGSRTGGAALAGLLGLLALGRRR